MINPTLPLPKIASDTVVESLQRVAKRYYLESKVNLYLDYFTFYEYAPAWLKTIAKYFDEEYEEGYPLGFVLENNDFAQAVVRPVKLIYFPIHPVVYGTGDTKEYNKRLIEYNRIHAEASSCQERVLQLWEKIRFDSFLMKTYCNITVRPNSTAFPH